jgi:hypothetical protein
MHLKRRRFILLVLFIFWLLPACSSPSMSELNCQVSDVDAEPPFILLKEETAVPDTAPFKAQMTGYHRAALSEYQLAYTDALCTLRIYRDAEIAEEARRLLCQQASGTEVTAAYGEAACGFENGGVLEVHFRQGTAVVTVREDNGGSHVSTWAEAVNGRLLD